MKKLYILFFLSSISAFSQNNLKELLQKHNTQSVAYISVESLKRLPKNIIILDAREKKEFSTSHLKGAEFVGYENFNLKKTIEKLPAKNAQIVVYCSLGIRSEDVAEQLKKAGYPNVLNLYGGIFEWKNSNNKVYNSKEIATEKVHVFSK
jgi:rhodanese-related sulfurtransferase